ncbi:hypothetical protein C2G38_2181713 [Gigaspora rosea]|uniref:Serine-threonine/tyrosine-protein kinase catalytic domain-containing protein n=1 Tax=Gigaspora rosea TaxID=44941 RepID=A0A397VBS3_9GLOM|nr:hypothetical protein C2G38_2181713 [Gigaspora rosea]
MWMFTSRQLPFRDHRYDEALALKTYNGARPQIINETTSCFIYLMQRCWNHDPEQRPTSSEIHEIIISLFLDSDIINLVIDEMTNNLIIIDKY